MKYTVELLKPKDHILDNFCCGITSIDNFLKRTAKKASRNDQARIWVIVDFKNYVLGYYSINMGECDSDKMPKDLAKKAPNHGKFPIAFISMMGVDKTMQNCNLGTLLLTDALKRIARLSEEIGTYAIILDVLDCGNHEVTERRKKFYEKMDFKSMPLQPLRLFIPIKTIKDAVCSNNE